MEITTHDKIEHYRNKRLANEQAARDEAMQRYGCGQTRAAMQKTIDELHIKLTVTLWVSSGAIVIMGYALYVALKGGAA